MTKFNERVEAVFEAALALETEAQRAEYVSRACPEPELRAEVESLLAAHEHSDSILEERTIRAELPLSEGPGTVIGRYKLLQKIGQGGMGVIYMAEQTEPVVRKVALKIIKLGLDTKSVIARFEAERQALAMMDHPNIARVLDAGATDTGRPYFVMELVKGVSVTQYCDKNHLPTQERLQLFISVCQAIQHAHQKGIIHRDIKPSNILVTLHDGKPVPKVIDFGIAKATNQKLTEKTLFTQFAQMIGTPAYMSPEQAEMSGLDVDTRTDVYSLGVLLYELLTGTTPFPEKELLSKGYGEMQRIIAEQEPERPSLRVSTLEGEQQTMVAKNRSTELMTLQRQVKGDLDWIVMRALEKDRTHRYDTPNSLAADIERHLSDEPVLAARPTVYYQLSKLYRRHKLALATAAGFVLVLAVSACVSTAQAIKNKSLFTAAEEAKLKAMDAQQRETELRRIAETERSKAETERDHSQRLLYGANMNLAKVAWDEATVSRVVELLDQHRPQPGQPDLRNFEWFYLDRLCHTELLTLKGHSNRVWSVAFSPDGKRLASASGDHLNPNKPGELKVWDAMTGQETLTLKGHDSAAWTVAFSPDGKRLASASADGTVKVWDAASGQETLALKGHAGQVYCVMFSPEGKRLASASGDRTVKVWDSASGRETLTLKGHTATVWSVAFSPDGKRLASVSGDGVVKLWDATSGQETLTLKGDAGWVWGAVSGVAFSPDGKRLASVNDRTVKVWDTTTGQETLTLKGHSGMVMGVAFSPDGKRLASASQDGMMKVWDAASGQELLTLKGHPWIINSVAFSPDGKRLASGSWDQTVKVWDVTRAQESLTLKGHTDEVYSVAFSPDGRWLASAGRDRKVKLWDASSGQETLTLKGHTGAVASVVFSPDGKRLASATGYFYDKLTKSKPGEVKVWDATSGQEILTLKGHARGVLSVAFSSDGKRLASASWDQTVKVWDAMSGQEMLTLKGHTNGVAGVAFSPDGKRLASASWDQTIKVWDTTSGQETLALKGHTDRVSSVAFSPDGKRLASSSIDGTVRVWDATSGQEMLRLKGHIGVVYGVAFSPDGKRLASVGDLGAVKVWDATRGQELLTLKGHSSEAWSVAFSPDGKRLASASLDGTVKLWDARPRSQESTAEAKTR